MYNNTSFFPDHGWRLPKCWGGHIPTNRWYACQRIATWKTRRNWQHVYISCCPRQGCHFTKLDESLQCLRCNTKASPLAHGIPIVYGITAIRSITNCHTQQSVQIKAFTNVLQKFYFDMMQITLTGDSNGIEDKLLDLMPLEVVY